MASVIGATATKVKDLLRKNRNGTVLIDEAYRLSEPSIGTTKMDFGREAIDEIMAAISGDTDDSTRRPALIFAGYIENMRSFVDSNPGLKRRIHKTLTFQDYSTLELMQIFRLKVERSDFNLDADVNLSMLSSMITHLDLSRHNGGFADLLFTQAKAKNGVRVCNLLSKCKKSELSDDVLQSFTMSDCILAVKDMVREFQ